MSSGEVCPTCGSAEHGCVVRDVGAVCYGPPRRAPAPPSSGEWTPAMRKAVTDFQRTAPVQPLVVGRDIGEKTARALGLIVTFSIPPSSPRVPCRRCDVPVVWIELPTGGRMAVTAETREAHDATCTGRRMAP